MTANLNGPIAALSCVVEVTTSQNLHSGLGTYTAVNALNPAYFKLADSSLNTNPLTPSPVQLNGFLQFPIGINATVTGDDGVSHNLALTPSTLYYGRIQCHGDTQQFTFTTASSDSAEVSFAINSELAEGAATATVYYGPTYATSEDNSASCPVTGGRFTCTVTVSSDFTYYGIVQDSGYSTQPNIYIP